MKLDETKIAAYKELEKWTDERTEVLKKERNQESRTIEGMLSRSDLPFVAFSPFVALAK
jgi:hypothetical protein